MRPAINADPEVRKPTLEDTGSLLSPATEEALASSNFRGRSTDYKVSFLKFITIPIFSPAEGSTVPQTFSIAKFYVTMTPDIRFRLVLG